MKSHKYIAYYRVSTDKQGSSGLGLEAQKQAVKQWLNGGQWELLEEFIEVESGKKTNRNQLQLALQACKKHKATLIIAKLDRLARNVHFISGLMEAGIEFVAVDNPHANKLMLHMLAAFAEYEREQISKRTCEALQAAKKRGVKLGANANNLSIKNKDAAQAFADNLRTTIDAMKAQGINTIRAITEELNRLQVPTFHNKGQWHIPATHRLMKRITTI
jgi:DNA invertase Pin-like site-specific DNA recombinase